ncbi:MAG: hypothetical protein ABI378_11920 [Chitinophagaceae bacterium]
MTKANLNRMDMCQTVQALLLGEHDVWKGNIGFAESVGELGACIDAIDAAANAQMAGNTVGVTKDKKKLAKSAIEKTLLLTKLARAYARIAKNQTLLTAVNKSKGSLQKTPLDELTIVLNAMLEAALGVKEELVKYGFKPTMEEEADAAIVAFEEAKPGTRVIISGRAAKTASIPKLMKRTKVCLLVLDDLIEVFREDHREFVARYTMSRIIVDYGVRHGGKKMPPTHTD